MAESFDFDKFKQKTSELAQTSKKKFGYLYRSVQRSGVDGAKHWFKSHSEIDALEIAIADLNQQAESDDFCLLDLYQGLTLFTLPEEDMEQAHWYKNAHDYLQTFEQQLVDSRQLDEKLLKTLINELKFISQANDFHACYHIEAIQKKVTKLYLSLQQALLDYKNLEKDKIELEKEQNQLKQQQIEADKAKALLDREKMAAIKMKEKRMAEIEEKKRKQAEKELLEAQSKKDNEAAELAARQAEIDRQAKLQDSYIELQLESKLMTWGLGDWIDKMLKTISRDSLPEPDKQKLDKIVSALSN